MRSSLVVAAVCGLSLAMPAQLVARDPVCVTTTVYIDDWNTAMDTMSARPTGGFSQHNGELTRGPPCPLLTRPDYTPPAPTPTPPAETPAAQAAPASSSAPAQAPAASPAASGGSLNTGSYADMVVSNHNVHRSNHSAPAMVWDQGLADTALIIAQSCVYAHNV